MVRLHRLLFGGGLAIGGAILTAQLSQVEVAQAGAEASLLRLAWSGRPERIEDCRRLTDTELEDVPAHMRQRVRCEGTTATYRLLVTVDGVVVTETSLAGGGARNDRPIHVLHDVALKPGRHQIEVAVRRVEPDPSPADSAVSGAVMRQESEPAGGAIEPAREQRERTERSRGRREAMPSSLLLSETLVLGEGEVVLVTYDRDERRLVLIRRKDHQGADQP